MQLLASSLLVLAVLPRAEDPWPETISIDFPFAVAGGIGMLVSAFCPEASERRDEAIRVGGFWGFWLGLLFYGLALFNQVLSA